MSATYRHVLELGFLTSQTPGTVVDRIVQLCTPLDVPAGTRLFSEGAADHRFLVIAHGQIDLEMHVPGRGDIRLMSLGPGEIVGWSALLGHPQMTATARATHDSRLLMMNGPELRAACEDDHEFGYYVMTHLATALSRRLLATRLQLLDLFSQDHSQGRAT